MAEKKKRKKKDKYSENTHSGGHSLSDYSANNSDFMQKSREIFEEHWQNYMRQGVTVVEEVFQLKAQGELNISAQRRQQAMDLFMAGENMKDMAGHAYQSARKNVQQREIANKTVKRTGSEANQTVASKIARNKPSNSIYEEEQVAETPASRNMRISKNFSVRRQEFKALNTVLTQSKEATGSIPDAMLKAAAQSLYSFYLDCASLPPGHPLKDEMCGHVMQQLESGDLDAEGIHSLLGYNP